jgi:hypothetical protein
VPLRHVPLLQVVEAPSVGPDSEGAVKPAARPIGQETPVPPSPQ